MELNETAFAYQKRKYSIDEYLALEGVFPGKNEYYKGEVFAMAGAGSQHNKVAKNLLVALELKLRGKTCEPFGSDTRIHIEKNTLFTYPDISVICGTPLSRNNDDINFLNPAVIFEVLSASTRNYDKGAKFALYQEMPTLQEYILVEPETIYVEAHRIDKSGTWLSEVFNTIDQTLILPSLGLNLVLREIYTGTKIASGL